MPIKEVGSAAFLSLPSEIHKQIFDNCDRKSLGRLEQSCTLIRERINPYVESVNERGRSPWMTALERDYPNSRLPNIKEPKNAKLLYKSLTQAAQLQHMNKLALMMSRFVEIMNSETDILVASKDIASFTKAIRPAIPDESSGEFEGLGGFDFIHDYIFRTYRAREQDARTASRGAHQNENIAAEN
jgi:hypothetical protein